jgi:hypothetical protein
MFQNLRKKEIILGVYVPMAATKINFFWYVTSCGLVEIY